MADFGISGVKTSGYGTREFVMQILGKCVVRCQLDRTGSEMCPKPNLVLGMLKRSVLLHRFGWLVRENFRNWMFI